MTHVDISINGRTYAIACDDGQEPHVTRLARYLDQKVAGLAKNVGQVGDARLLVMASLLIVDELVDTDQALKQARTGAHSSAPPAIFPVTAPATADEALIAQNLNHLAERIEAIVDRLNSE